MYVGHITGPTYVIITRTYSAAIAGGRGGIVRRVSRRRRDDPMVGNYARATVTTENRDRPTFDPSNSVRYVLFYSYRVCSSRSGAYVSFPPPAVQKRLRATVERGPSARSGIVTRHGVKCRQVDGNAPSVLFSFCAHRETGRTRFSITRA